MRKLHLIRHGQVMADRHAPSAEWTLAPGAEAPVLELAQQFEASPPRRIISSTEPKARQTAEIIAAHFGIEVEVRPGLEEHHRDGAAFIPNPAEFRATLMRMFRRPQEKVFGSETAAEAGIRFLGAIAELMDSGEGDEVVVTHGAVMSLLLGAIEDRDPFEICTGLGSPDLRTVTWPPEDASASAGVDAEEAR